MRIAGAGDLEIIARLALVEIQHRSAPPMFAPRQDRPLADLAAEHRALREAGAVHLLATLDGHDVGLLTIELTSPVPRLCPDGQPYIGPTATLAAARGQGVGHALVDTTLTWAHDHGYQWVSVDFDTANPLSPAILAARRLPPGRIRRSPPHRRPAGGPARIRRRPLNTDHHALPGSRAPGIRRGPLRSCGRLPLSYIEGRARRLRLGSRPSREILPLCMLWGDGRQAPATAQMRLIWACPTGTGGLSGGRDGLVIGALGETGQLKKGEGSWLSTSARRCSPLASSGCPRSARRGTALAGNQLGEWQDYAGRFVGATLRLSLSLLRVWNSAALVAYVSIWEVGMGGQRR